MWEIPVGLENDTIDLKENFSFDDSLVLKELAEKVAEKNCVFIEIGSWKGHSTSFLGAVAKRYEGYVFAVDHWNGTPGVPDHQSTKDCLSIFRHNMKVLGLDKTVFPMVMDSVVASSIFPDNFADLIFIDADHKYKSIKQDLAIWWPKVKTGGIFCGHDSDMYYSEFNHASIPVPYDVLLEFDGLGELVYKNKSYILNQGMTLHAGVSKALYEQFNDQYDRAKSGSVWSKRK